MGNTVNLYDLQFMRSIYMIYKAYGQFIRYIPHTVNAYDLHLLPSNNNNRIYAYLFCSYQRGKQTRYFEEGQTIHWQKEKEHIDKIMVDKMLHAEKTNY